MAHLEAQGGVLTSGVKTKAGKAPKTKTTYGQYNSDYVGVSYGDTGTAARFFPQFHFSDDDALFHYVAKASRGERENGCSLLPRHSAADMVDRTPESAGMESPRAGAGRTSGAHNYHPTVKPISLMQWLVRLVTAPGQTVLDPYAGSGTTAVAAIREDRGFLLIERDKDYWPICEARIRHAQGLWTDPEVA